MVELENKQVEHELISTSLEVEKLEANLFRSKSLWIPIRARGVFGGQVISQALVSATECVDPAYALHSMHCYFLLSASPAIPIVYHVDRVRDGRSYVTRAVRAVQNGRTVFIAMCSFQRPEPRQPSYQTPMPAVQGPEQCDDVEVYYEKILMSPVEVDSRIKEYALEYVQERKKSPIAIKTAGIISEDGMKTHMYWFKARNVPKFDSPAKEAAYQKCILSYISDSHFLVVARRTLGLDSFAKGAQRLAMLTTLDHTIWFYDDSFDCGDWLLYVVAVAVSYTVACTPVQGHWSPSHRKRVSSGRISWTRQVRLRGPSCEICSSCGTSDYRLYAVVGGARGFICTRIYNRTTHGAHGIAYVACKLMSRET